MTEEKEEFVLLNPDLKEDDIPYDIPVDPNDELGDAKMHVRHAESRIHALRARLKHRAPRKETAMMSTDYGTTTSSSTMTTTTTTTTESEISVMKTKLMELERIIKEKDEVNRDYQTRLAALSGKDGSITSLRSGKAELQTKLSSAAEQLAASRERTLKLEQQVESMGEGAAELSKLQQENIELQETISEKEFLLKSQTDANGEQLQEISDKNAELAKLREQSDELSLKLSTLTGKRDGELNRLRQEKLELHEQVVRNGEDMTKARNASTKLQQDGDDRRKQVDQLRVQLEEKDSNLKTLQLKKKGLSDEVADLSKQQRLVGKLKLELTEKQGNFERSKNQNNQLLISERALKEKVESLKTRAGSKEQAYLDLQKKLADMQSALAGDHNKEVVLQEQLTKLENESREMNQQYQIEFSRAEDLTLENGRLKEKLSGSYDTTLQKSRLLREQLDEQLSIESKVNKENGRIKNELNGVLSESSKNEQMYIALKKMYDEEKAAESSGKIEDQKKVEQELQERILLLDKEATEKELRLKNARDLEEQRGYEISTTFQRLTQTGKEVSETDMEIERLRQELATIGSDDVKRQEDDDINYKNEMAAMMAKKEEWRLKALASQKSELETRSEMESQIKLMESREEMVQARDQKIGHLKNAKRRVDGSVDLSKEEMERMFFGIQVTSVVDHRENHDHKVLNYKHERPLSDYHDHVLRVDHDPAYILETEIETIRRRKEYEAAKKRKRTNRRPSIG